MSVNYSCIDTVAFLSLCHELMREEYRDSEFTDTGRLATLSGLLRRSSPGSSPLVVPGRATWPSC